MVVGETEAIETQIGELLGQVLLVENADDGVLAVNRRHDRDTEVDLATAQVEFEATVLRHPLLGDVEIRHDLDARDDRVVVAQLDWIHGRIEHAIDTVLDPHRILARLHMNIGGTALERVHQGRVDEANDRVA